MTTPSTAGSRLSARDVASPGLMLRREWARALLDEPGGLEWIEVFPENFMRRGPALEALADRLSERFVITSHGVHLSIGDRAALDPGYLDALQRFLRRVDAPWFSDHLGVSVVDDHVLHEILPVPFHPEVAAHVARRAREVQDRMQRPFLLENAAYYTVPPSSVWAEAQFLAEVVEGADCGILLDANNLFVNATNHGYDPHGFLDALPAERVWQLHLGGYTTEPDGLLVDTHGAPPADSVWELFDAIRARFPAVPAVFEWESGYSGLDVVRAQLERMAGR